MKNLIYHLHSQKDYHADSLAGQKVVFTITLKSIKEALLPEVDDKFAAKAGPFKTVKELKDDIKRELTAGREHGADDKFKDALIDKLGEVVRRRFGNPRE